MAGNSSQSFTLSELAKFTRMNISSCHSILNVLEARGYLSRHPVQKTYRLAPALAAIGAAVRAADPVIDMATLAARELARQTGFEVLISARAGSESIKLDRIAHSELSRVTMRIGQRTPLRPPVGAPFIAWSSEAEIAEWLKRGDQSPEMVEANRHSLALVRERGFLVSIAHEDGDEAHYQPEEFVPDALYDVQVISAPIFDVHGQVSYTMSISAISEPLTGKRIKSLAAQLVAACKECQLR